MDKSKIRNYQIFSIIFTFLLGTLLHFTYEMSGENKIVAIFSAVNESTWEHLKLLYFPMIITTLIGYFYIGKNTCNYWCAKAIGIISSIIMMIVFFYTYSGILGYNIALIDISSFYIDVIIGEFISYKLILNKFKCNNKISIVILLLLLLCFIFFTFSSPKIGIFKDPVTGEYRVNKKYYNT